MTRPKARRTRPPASQLDAKADYADAFEVAISDGDLRTAEQAFRDGLGPEPGAIGRLVWWVHRHVLRFRLGPVVSSDYAIGWKVGRSDPDQFVLTTEGSLMRGQLMLRREGERRAVLSTQLIYRHNTAARMVWAMVGPVHRALAPRLMETSARRGSAPAARR